MRPTVRPGLHVLRRDVRSFQLGLEWPGVAVVRDTPAVRAVLDAVDGYRDVAGVLLAATSTGVPRDEARFAVGALLSAGALVDQAAARPDGIASSGWSAMWLLAGTTRTAADVLAARRRLTVQVDGVGQVADHVRTLLAAEQVALTENADRAAVRVLASDRDIGRDRADDAMRRGEPFLCVGIRELVGLIGPFVVPGRSACLRCVDLDRAHREPAWPTLVTAAAAKPVRQPAAAPSLVAIIAGYAAQEVALWASGARPVSWNCVVEIPHGLGAVQTVPYPLHPLCGCGWFASHDTMSA